MQDEMADLGRAVKCAHRDRAKEIPKSFGSDAVTRLGAFLALNLGSVWDEGTDGPIDVIDLFSGAGGVSAGFKAVNAIVPAYKLVLAVDTDDIANKTFARNLGLQPTNVDVGKLAKSDRALRKLVASSERRDGHPLVTIGCVPCQGFASHRNSAGKNDPRNSLFVDMARIATSLAPDAIVMENVPELATTKYWHYLSAAKDMLIDSGYWVHVSVQNMAGFGVPQERFRMLLVAFRRPFAEPKAFLARAQFRTVRDAIGHLPRIRVGSRSRADRMHYCPTHNETTLETIRSVPRDGGSLPDGFGPQSRKRLARRQGSSSYDDIYGRLHWDRPAVTITAHSRNPASGRFVHPSRDRGLSVREAALLQGFPTGFHFEGGLTQQFRQIGNAVPPVFSAWLAMYTLGRLIDDGHETTSFCPGLEHPVGTSFSRLIPAIKAGSLDIDRRRDPVLA